MRAEALFLPLALLLAGCDGGGPVRAVEAVELLDGGTGGASVVVVEGGAGDAGMVDAGELEADPGDVDAGELDAGDAAVDAGELDAGASDAAELDGGCMDCPPSCPPGYVRHDAGCPASPEMSIHCCWVVDGGP